jgi:hypothetical protein
MKKKKPVHVWIFFKIVSNDLEPALFDKIHCFTIKTHFSSNTKGTDWELKKFFCVGTNETESSFIVFVFN